MQTKDIILTPIGGLARLVSMPKRPLEEFVITIAGPSVNLVISGLIGLYLLTVGSGFALEQDISASDLPIFLYYINLFLFLFNLIPAFPMDGGRILRATLASFCSFCTATLIAGKSYPFLHKSAINLLNSSRAKCSVKPCDPLYSKILAVFNIFNG